MRQLIINNIIIHTIDHNPNDATKPLNFLPGVVFFDDCQHEVRIFRKTKDSLFNKCVAVAESLVFEQHSLAWHIFAHIVIDLDQISVIGFQGVG